MCISSSFLLFAAVFPSFLIDSATFTIVLLLLAFLFSAFFPLFSSCEDSFLPRGRGAPPERCRSPRARGLWRARRGGLTEIYQKKVLFFRDQSSFFRDQSSFFTADGAQKNLPRALRPPLVVPQPLVQQLVHIGRNIRILSISGCGDDQVTSGTPAAGENKKKMGGCGGAIAPPLWSVLG